MEDALKDEQPEYVYRPAIYFHAADDAEAKTFAAQLRAAIEDDVLGPARFAYDQAWHEENTLACKEHFPAAERVI